MTTFNDTYEIKSLIGKGGMSTVYLAEHKRLHTLWVVKEVRKQQNARFDFLAESNILKRLQHPMLPRIVDIFEDRECIYIVEDYVEGITLEDLLKQQKRVDEAQGLQWFRDLCGVLNYLHNQRPRPIIYRDMKPSNVMLQPDGMLKLIDFGIAREYKQESSADTTYIGTQGYAAPEQFGKAQTDARTDIYALGVTMYHLLTGKSPYEPPYQFVPARQLAPELSRGIEYILNKRTQSEPADRYQNMDELLDDIEHIYRFDAAWKKYQNAKRIRVATIAIMLAASLGLMVGGGVLMKQEADTVTGHPADSKAPIVQPAPEPTPADTVTGHPVDSKAPIVQPAPEPTPAGTVTIAGTEYPLDITKLDLTEAGLTDQDIVNVAMLTNLEELRLGGNQITDLSPLAGLTNLTRLYLPSNQIADLSPLAGLTNLTRLSLAYNQIADLSPLAGLTNLEVLMLHYNQITDLSPLAGLPNLGWLSLVSSQITDLSLLAGLTNLTGLSLVSNQITDLSPLAGLTNLTDLELYYNQITDLSPLAGLTNLTDLQLSGNQITDLSPLAGLTNLTELVLSGNESEIRVDELQAALPNCEILW